MSNERKIAVIYEFDVTVAEGVRAINSLFAEYASEEYAAGYVQRRQWLRRAFRDYRTSGKEERDYLKQLVEMHAEECRQGSAEIRRRHNTFVLAYMANRKFTPKEIAGMQRITPRAVWKDLNHVLDTMMLLAFGVEGINPTGNSTHGNPSEPR